MELLRTGSGLASWGRSIRYAQSLMPEQTTRRFPPPWTVEQIAGGYKVKDANGQSLAYVYGRETQADADIARVLTGRGTAYRQQYRQAADFPRARSRNILLGAGAVPEK